jgi:uncharacterized protein (DUF885 family)
MNTYNLPARPLYTLAALTLHECTPGHSFQAALALEGPERPPFRRGTSFSGYGEVERYIAWPGQALAYKLGELQILRHRREAEEKLGPKFDQRLCHDAVLAIGSVPLPVLDQRMSQFIADGGVNPPAVLKN